MIGLLQGIGTLDGNKLVVPGWGGEEMKRIFAGYKMDNLWVVIDGNIYKVSGPFSSIPFAVAGGQTHPNARDGVFVSTKFDFKLVYGNAPQPNTADGWTELAQEAADCPAGINAEVISPQRLLSDNPRELEGAIKEVPDSLQIIRRRMEDKLRRLKQGQSNNERIEAAVRKYAENVMEKCRYVNNDAIREVKSLQSQYADVLQILIKVIDAENTGEANDVTRAVRTWSEKRITAFERKVNAMIRAAQTLDSKLYARYDKMYQEAQARVATLETEFAQKVGLKEWYDAASAANMKVKPSFESSRAVEDLLGSQPEEESEKDYVAPETAETWRRFATSLAQAVSTFKKNYAADLRKLRGGGGGGGGGADAMRVAQGKFIAARQKYDQVASHYSKVMQQFNLNSNKDSIEAAYNAAVSNDDVAEVNNIANNFDSEIDGFIALVETVVAAKDRYETALGTANTKINAIENVTERSKKQAELKGIARDYDDATSAEDINGCTERIKALVRDLGSGGGGNGGGGGVDIAAELQKGSTPEQIAQIADKIKKLSSEEFDKDALLKAIQNELTNFDGKGKAKGKLKANLAILKKAVDIRAQKK